MKLLLDTHALLWFLESSSALSQPAWRSRKSRTTRFVSHATAWELAIKLNLGKLTLQVPYEDVFPRVVEANGFQFLTSRFEHYRECSRPPATTAIRSTACSFPRLA
jgi:PIN domain nuclease of toxin-antitoxin system